jgi:cell division protein FtsW
MPAAKHSQNSPDLILFWVIIVLMIIGLIALFSASMIVSIQNTISPKNPNGSATYYFFHQILYGILPGIFLGFIFYKIPPQKLKNLSILLYLLTIFLLFSIFLFPQFRFKAHGASSWLIFRGITFQPAEIAKLSLIIYLAGFFTKKIKENKISKSENTLLPFLAILAPIGILLIAQPDLGTLGVIALTSLLLYFFAGGKISHILLLIFLGLFLFLISINLFPHQFERITVFLNPEKDPLGSAYQIRQSLIAVGSGGIFGVGIGNGVQKYNYLPEPMGDTIFAVWAEETGFIGTLVLISTYLIIGLRGFIISKRVSDKFLQLLACGITSWILVQAFVNIGGVLKLLPFTGIPLPLVSYGGSAIIVTICALAILLNISKYANI